jgi:hypothetical protein
MLSVAWNGNPVRPPDVASDWFRIDFGWLPVAQGGDAIEEIIVPSTLDRLAFRQRGRAHWVKLGESRKAAEYAELVEGLTPFSAESFPSGLRVEIPQAASDDGGAALPWLPLGAGVGLLVSLGALVLRRRAAGTPD